VQAGDVTRLTRIPGVGRKTAERMTLELRDRLPAVDAGAAAVAASDAGSGLRDDVASALVNLGYARPQAEKALDALAKEAAGLGFEELLRRTLRHLSR
jgi:Holliday junction DNA helicase RuvA